MAKSVDELINFNPGDIITLSDLQTQKDYDSLKTDFLIEETRLYEDPNDLFKIYAYIVKPEVEGKEDEPPYMIAIKAVGNDFDVFVYYLDSDGPVYLSDSDDEEAEQDCDFLGILNDDYDSFKDRLEVTMTKEEGEGTQKVEITWDLQQQTHGVEFIDGNDEGITSLAEYFTNDDTGGNPHCLIDWRGDAKDGFMEVWYGCTIEPHEIEIVASGE